MVRFVSPTKVVFNSPPSPIHIQWEVEPGIEVVGFYAVLGSTNTTFSKQGFLRYYYNYGNPYVARRSGVTRAKLNLTTTSGYVYAQLQEQFLTAIEAAEPYASLYVYGHGFESDVLLTGQEIDGQKIDIGTVLVVK